MALSNVFREPRRELTEQAFGLAAFGGFICLDLAVASAICLIGNGTIHVAASEFLLCMLMALFVMTIMFAVSGLVHWAGEAVCDAMANRGYDPRPKNRYR